MMRTLAAFAVACQVAFATTATAVDLISIDFESGNLAPAGSAGDGWKLWSVSGNNRSSIASTGRSFLTGSSGNDEALVINPATPGAAENDLEGAEFVTSTPITIGQNDMLYLITETFSDIAAFSDQYLKLDVRWGTAGDGAAYGEFDSTAGGSTWSVNHNYNTEPSGGNRQGRVAVRDSTGSNTTAEVVDARYIGDDVTDGIGDVDSNPGDPANNFLDRTYVTKTLYRPGAGDGTQVNGESQGVGYDGTSVVSTFNKEATDDNPDIDQLLPAYGQLDIDRVSIHMRRHIGTYDGTFVGNPDELLNGFAGHTGLSSPFEPDENGVIPNGADIQFGIKSLRIGIATVGDLNLDGVVDGTDEAVAQGNLGMASGATFFDGDFDNDGDVDGDDLAIFDSGLAGDANGDGMVDLLDLDILGANFGVSPATLDQGDFNGDNVVDLLDLDILGANFGAGSASAVPEPAAATLFGLVLLGGVMRRR